MLDNEGWKWVANTLFYLVIHAMGLRKPLESQDLNSAYI